MSFAGMFNFAWRGFRGDAIEKVTADEWRLVWLDELRGVAALAVLLGHYRVLLIGAWDIPVMDFFARGVQLFYILSGYILYRLYSNKMEQPKGKRKFFVKRFFRIAPLYYLITLIAFLIFFSSIEDPWNNLVAHLLILVSGFDPAWINGIIGVEWSIFVEFSFYLFFPLLLPWFRRNMLFSLLITLLFSFGQTLVVYLMCTDVETRTYFYNLPSTQLCFFVLGMWIADLHVRMPSIPKGRLLAMLSCGLILVIPFVIKAFTLHLYAAFFILGAFVYGYPHVTRPEIIKKVLGYCGSRSYSIYLIHMPILTYYRNEGGEDSIFFWGLLLSVVILLSDITFRTVEQKGIALGQYFAKRV